MSAVSRCCIVRISLLWNVPHQVTGGVMDVQESGVVVPPICEDLCKADAKVDENLSQVLCGEAVWGKQAVVTVFQQR